MFYSQYAALLLIGFCSPLAGLLMALTTGCNLSRRAYEMVCLYMTGWADDEDLLAAFPPSRQS